MIESFRFGADARIFAIGDTAEVCAVMQSGRAKLQLRLAPMASGRLALELSNITDPGAAETRRPRPPTGEWRNWREISTRLARGAPTSADLGAVMDLLESLGLRPQ